jgi:hypothetical protein
MQQLGFLWEQCAVRPCRPQTGTRSDRIAKRPLRPSIAGLVLRLRDIASEGISFSDIISKHFLVEPELLSESDDSDSRPSLLPNYQAWVVRRGVSCHLPAALKVECWFMTA